MKIRITWHRDTTRLVTTLCGVALALLSARGAHAEALNFPPSDFDILSSVRGPIIGHARYTLVETPDELILHGENRYLNGAYDIEDDKLSNSNGHPALISFRHDFFNADGSPFIAGRLDTETGLGVCVKNEGKKMEIESDELKLPADTYAGASVLIPIQNFVRADKSGETLTLHVFNCAPGPKLIEVAVKLEPTSTWPDYPGELEKADVKPNLGFWTIVIQPFIPKIAAWFDPSENMLLVGAQLERYYRGPKMVLVRQREASIGKGPPSAPPSAP